MRRSLPAVLLAVLLVSRTAGAAGYPRYGGVLRLATPGAPSASGAPSATSDPTLADSPAEAALRALEVSTVCQLDERAVPTPLLASGWEEDEKPALELKLPSSELAQAQAQAWTPGVASPSPYRALLFPLRGVRADGAAVRLTLSFPWPDLLVSLCHPALALRKAKLAGAGPYAPRKGTLIEQLSYPSGRPYPDGVELRVGAERAAQRLFSLGEADVWLGGTSDAASPQPAPMLFATYLAFRPAATGPDFRGALESAVDRVDLARYFVRAPAAPLSALLPSPLLPPEGPKSPAPAPPPLVVPRPLKLVWDESLPDQRSVAERLQVKLHDLGYRVSLEPLSRSALRQRWAKGDFELMLHSVLLPPFPAPALAVVLDLAGRRDLLPLELPPLGMLDPTARQERVRSRATFLAPALSLVPLYVQGLNVALGPSVRGLTWDGQGVPRLDGLWLAP